MPAVAESGDMPSPADAEPCVPCMPMTGGSVFGGLFAEQSRGGRGQRAGRGAEGLEHVATEPAPFAWCAADFRLEEFGARIR